MIINTDDYNPNALALQLLSEYRDECIEAIKDKRSDHNDLADALVHGRNDQWISEALDSTASSETASLADAARVLVASDSRDAWRDVMDSGDLSGDTSDIMSTMAFYAARQDVRNIIFRMTDDEITEALGIAVCWCCGAVCDVPEDFQAALDDGRLDDARSMLPDGWQLDASDDPTCPDCIDDGEE